jgi:membrane associated rhomboid family serine protease
MSYQVTFRGDPQGGFNLGPIGFLIIVNLLLFIVSFFFGNSIHLLGLSPTTFSSRPWTLITSMFMHAGIGHIFANMFTLYFFGNTLFRMVGERNFLLVYFLGGLLGGILYVWLARPLSIAVGASGAVFAVAGALAVLIPKDKVYIFPIPAPIPLWIAVIGGFMVMSFFPFVAWQAHLGGLVLGLAAGYYFKKNRSYFR